ncbi:MAG: hypothetical protein Q8O01_06095 [Candidatus Omnitrophota bacterium]|nr:hypothetical protein [Candidatus Omnitrophota bacterium]
MLDAMSNAPAVKAVWPIRVKRFKFTHRPFFILSLAIIFLFNALGGDLLIGEVWAAGLPELTSVGSEKSGGHAPLKDLNADTFSLPPELGYIQESVKVPDSGRTVIHIQDAHCNYAAQKSIAEILNYLTKEYGIYAVNCEGGKGDYDLSVFTSIEEKGVRQKTSDFFVKEGVVNAAEYFAVNNPQKVKLWGVEDADLYIKNLKVYRDSLSHKDEVDRYIKSITYILNNLKRRIYSDELLEFDTYYTRYKENAISFKEYMAYLIMTAQKKLIDIKSFSNIYILSRTLMEEDKINFKKANNEKDEVVDRLKKVLSKNELEELINKVGQLKAERISQADFYAYLVKKAKSIKLDISVYPELQKYIIYISMYSAVDRTMITKEMNTLEDRIQEALYENDTQRELGILSKNITLTKNIFNISITRDDYAYYLERKGAFAVSNYVNFIDQKAPLYKIRAVLDKNITNLDRYREGMEKFYEYSFERDKAFIKNIKFTDCGRPNSIIITGGFHTENLRELFKNEKVSYVSIMPKFRNEKGYESPYMKRLAGQRTALENVIDTAIPAILNLQVVNILSQLAPEVEGRNSMEKFKIAVAIIAAVNAGQQFVIRIDAKVPIKGMLNEEEKFVTFTKGEGAEPVDYTINYASGVSAQDLGQINAEVTTGGFKLNPLAQARSPARLAAPVIQPFAVIDSVTGRPVEIARPAETAVTAKIAEPIYESAKNIVPQIARALRRASPTWDISPAASEEDIAPTTSNNRKAEQILGKDGHEIHAKSYLAKGDWMKNLKDLLEKTLPGFVKDAQSNPRSRMAIRIMSDPEGATVNDVRSFIREFLVSKAHSAAAANKIIDTQIRFIPIDIQNIRHLNTAIDLFTDIGMMEIDRYIQGDYPGEELPPELRDRFLALLKLSITNFDDIMKFVKTEEDIKGILNAIFKVSVLLRIRPVDWKSIDEWKRAQDAILQAV